MWSRLSRDGSQSILKKKKNKFDYLKIIYIFAIEYYRYFNHKNQ